MHARARSTTLGLILCVLLAGLLAGCGAGSDQSGSGPKEGAGGNAQQGGNQNGGAQQGGDKASKKKAAERKIAIGTVRAALPDKRRISLKPNADAQSKEPLGFKVRKGAEVTLDGKKAEMSDIERGQQAQIQYIVINKANRAVAVQLFKAGDGSGGEDKEEQN